MKIAYMIPGTGGAFYCENCIRDCALVSGLKSLGHEVIPVPLYLPINLDEGIPFTNDSIFYGAVKIYLKGRFPFLKNVSDKIFRILDTPALLKLASAMASSTRAVGNEELTLTMLKDTKGILASEFERLASFIFTKINPDAIFLSNAFLLGLGSALKNYKNTTVVCMLQDEHTWVESSRTTYQSVIWNAIAQNVQGADLYLTLSSWYKNKAVSLMRIPSNRIHIIPFGVNPQAYTISSFEKNPPTIGYLGHQCFSMGFDTYIEAYIQLMNVKKKPNYHLSINGGSTKDDRKLIDTCMYKLKSSGLDNRVTFYSHFCLSSRISFFSNLMLFSVPTRDNLAFGTFVIEAMTAGVPVVQPDKAGFTEIIQETQGGILFTHDSIEDYVEAMNILLTDKEKWSKCSEQGRQAVLSKFNNTNMARTAISTIENG